MDLSRCNCHLRHCDECKAYSVLGIERPECPLLAPIGSRIWFKDKYNQNEFIGTVVEFMNHENCWWYKVRVDKVLNNRYLDENAVGVIISAEESEVVEYER